ncbi:MAG: FAD-dependent oxidoreductase [Kiritimatiellia bacterium]
MSELITGLPLPNPLDGASLDVLVVGGGIVGAGVARDAAMRGLAAGLCEMQDFAAGTSSRSSRLLHGGIRYLGQGRVGLVREAGREKAVLRRIAPHLFAPLPFLYPALKGGPWSPAMLRIGTWIYDLIARSPAEPRSRRVPMEEIARLAPGIDLARLRGAVVYSDAMTNDARLVIDTLLSAAAHGARVRNHLKLEAAEAATAPAGAAASPTRSPGPHARSRPAASSTPPDPGPAPSRRAAPACAPPRASTSSSRGNACRCNARSCSPRGPASSSPSRGANAPTSARPTPTTPARSNPRAWNRPTPPTCSTPSPAPSPPRASPRPTSSPRGRACARSCANATARPPTSPGRTRSVDGGNGWFDVTGGKLTKVYRLMAEQTVDRVVRRSPRAKPRPAVPPASSARPRAQPGGSAAARRGPLRPLRRHRMGRHLRGRRHPPHRLGVLFRMTLVANGPAGGGFYCLNTEFAAATFARRCAGLMVPTITLLTAGLARAKRRLSSTVAAA